MVVSVAVLEELKQADTQTDRADILDLRNYFTCVAHASMIFFHQLIPNLIYDFLNLAFFLLLGSI